MDIIQLITCIGGNAIALDAIKMAFALALTVFLVGFWYYTARSVEHLRQMRRELARRDAEINRLKAAWAKSVAGD